MNKIHGGNIYEIGRQYGLRPDEIVDFSASINPLGLSPKAEKKLKDGLSAVRHYPDSESSLLRETLAQHHGIAEDQILVGAGATEFIYSLPSVLQIKRPLIVTPAFSEYENALENYASGSDLSIHYLETKEEDGFELSVGSLLFTLTQGYDALYLSNPNNPTGILTAKEDLLRILTQTEKENIWFILDETCVDFVEAESLKSAAAVSSRLIILRSLTPFYALPGLRVGYMISNLEVIRQFNEKKEPWTVTVLAQIAAVASLQDERYIAQTKKLVKIERENLIHGLRSIPGFIPYPSSANFLLVQLHPSLSLRAAELREKLIARGILIRDCRSFHHIGPFFFRVGVRLRKENNLLLKNLRQIRKEMA